MIEPSSDEPKMFAEGNKALVKRSKIVRWTWWTPILAVLTLAAFAVVAVRSLREPVLRAAGWALVANEPVAPADIIVLSLDSGGAGALEAADLVQSGISKRVAVFKTLQAVKTMSSSAGAFRMTMKGQGRFAN
jgi:hypothetical protein